MREKRGRVLSRLIGLAATGWIAGLAAVAPVDTMAEPRAAFTAAAPAALASVGRLLVPGRRLEDGYPRHYRESCSATLLRPARGGPAQLILTAWHCLEFHTDLTDEITFVIGSQRGGTLTRTATPLLSGGGMHADWALMRLQTPLAATEASAVSLRPESPPAAGTALIMAGFSRDPGLGRGGQRLTYHADCEVTDSVGQDIGTDCLAYRGASGGAVFDAAGERLLGVVSRGDSEGRSIFVPVSRIREPAGAGLSATP